MESYYRDYIRTTSWRIEAKVSEDGKTWVEVQVPNISASGLLFMAEKKYQKGDNISFIMNISPIVVGPDFTVKMKLNAVIKSDRGQQEGLYCYAVKFTDISLGDQIRLDELMRITVSKYGVVD